MVHISAAITPEWLSANERAYANRAAGRVVTRNSDGTYTAPSSKADGTAYLVTIVNVGALQASCTCPHGLHADAKGKCWHVAAALAAEVRRVSHKAAPQADRAAMEAKMARFARAS